MIYYTLSLPSSYVFLLQIYIHTYMYLYKGLYLYRGENEQSFSIFHEAGKYNMRATMEITLYVPTTPIYLYVGILYLFTPNSRNGK